jgi:hypothetical protein
MGYVQSFEKVKNACRRYFIKVAGRFIGQQEAGIANQSPRERYPLLLSAREFSGPVFGAVLQIDLPKPLRCRI